MLQQVGRTDLAEGSKVVCDLGHGRKGLQVITVHRVEAAEAGPEPEENLSQPFTGRVKFFNADKGFGFVIPDSGGPDIFVSARVLHQAGLRGLEPDMPVRVRVRMGPKGPMAASLEMI